MQGTYGNGRLVTVFGGSGFVGRHVVRALAMRGYRVRAAVRRPDLAGHLRPLGMVGQVQPVQANIRYSDSIKAAVEGAIAVVNLVGILAERGRQTFGAVHVDGAAAVASIANDAGVVGLVHMSALGADADSESHYFRTKAKGEEGVRQGFPPAVILRPSIQFGVGDSFFTRFAGIARMAPFLPLIGANTRFQPVYVGDVAAAVRMVVDGQAETGLTFELGGAEILTFRGCMAEMLKIIDRRRLLLSVPLPFAKLGGAVLQYLPGRVLTLDQVRQLQYDNVVSPAAIEEKRTLADLGIGATALAAILPTYLSRFRPHGEFRRQSQA
jgi:NADH dehydrogenase